MKFILTILLIPSLAFANTSLFVNIEDCNSHSFIHPAKDLQVFRNGEYISNLTDSLKSKTFLFLRNIEPGFYQFKYRNVYDLEVQDSITITENKSHEIHICVNKLGDIDPNFRGLIDSILPSTPLTFVVKSGGCFSTSITKMKIEKEGYKYYITYYNKVSSNGKTIRKTTQFKQIDKKELDLIRNFENELSLVNYVNNNSHVRIICTSQSGYEITLGNVKKRITDWSCNSGGIWKLADKLFK